MRDAVVVDDPMTGVLEAPTTGVIVGGSLLGAALPHRIAVFLVLSGTGNETQPEPDHRDH